MMKINVIYTKVACKAIHVIVNRDSYASKRMYVCIYIYTLYAFIKIIT